MSNLKIVGKKNLFGIEVPDLFGGFGGNEKSMLAKTIAEIHGREVFKVNELINNNRGRFLDGVHVLDLRANHEAVILLKDNEIMNQNAINRSTNIYLLSQRGYVRLLKIMDDDTAWEKWDVIENDYFEMKEQAVAPIQTLSPTLQVLINLELKQQEQDKAISEIASSVQGIRDVVALNPNDWRKDSSSLINKMAISMGGYEHVKPLRAESYKVLDERFGVDLQCRLTNKRRRMADEGVCKSKRDKLNQLDVIADDKKLIEGYVAIIKEMAIKYGLK